MAEDLLLGDFWDILCLCIVICLILDLLLNKIEASISCSLYQPTQSKALYKRADSLKEDRYTGISS